MADSTTYGSSRDFTKTITIAVGQTVSTALDCNGASIVGIEATNLTGTTYKIQRALTLDGTYKEFKTNDFSVIPSIVKSVELGINNTDTFGLLGYDFAGVQYIKLASNIVQAGVDATITLILRGTPS